MIPVQSDFEQYALHSVYVFVAEHLANTESSAYYSIVAW